MRRTLSAPAQGRAFHSLAGLSGLHSLLWLLFRGLTLFAHG